MYSRDFSDKADRHRVPPQYNGTALSQRRHEGGKREQREGGEWREKERCAPHEPCEKEGCGEDRQRETCRRENDQKEHEPSREEGGAREAPRRPGGKRESEGFQSLLRGLLHPGEDGGDLLLLLVAVLLLADGCEDEYLPFLLLLMLLLN